MAKCKRLLLCLFSLLLIRTTTAQAAVFEGHHLATAIDVVYRQDDKPVQHSYHNTENIEGILNYLRLLEYAGMPAEDPELQVGTTYRFKIHLADGNQHIYHLHADHYLSQNYKPWIKVESSRSFAALLAALPEET